MFFKHEIKNNSTKKYMILAPRQACGPAVLAGFLCLCLLGSSLSVHVCHPRDVLPVCWACRCSVGPGINRGARKLA
jgi:hypothetical protein